MACIGPRWPLNYWMVQRHPKPNEVVDNSIPGHEIFALLDGQIFYLVSFAIWIYKMIYISIVDVIFDQV